MKLTLEVVTPDGSRRTVHGTALPVHERPVIPDGAKIELLPRDMERLQSATIRLTRCSVARVALGSFQLTVNWPGGFVADKPINDLMLKALALEARPFFLNDDPLYFPALVKLKSFMAAPALGRILRIHTKRWKASAFNGVLGIKIGPHKLDIESVIGAWFNSDLFHTAPLCPEELSLAVLEQKLGGISQAQAILASHLTSSLTVVDEFLEDVMKTNAGLRSWVEHLLATKSPL